MQQTQQTQSNAPQPLFLRERELTELLNISRCTLRNLIDNANFPQPIRFGRAIRWHKNAVNEWLETQTQH